MMKGRYINFNSEIIGAKKSRETEPKMKLTLLFGRAAFELRTCDFPDLASCLSCWYLLGQYSYIFMKH